MARETTRDRRERVAAMQAAQKRSERRRLLVVIGACVAVIAIIAAAVTWAVVGEQKKKNQVIAGISGDATAASCDPITNDPASGSSWFSRTYPGCWRRRCDCFAQIQVVRSTRTKHSSTRSCLSCPVSQRVLKSKRTSWKLMAL